MTTDPTRAQADEALMRRCLALLDDSTIEISGPPGVDTEATELMTALRQRLAADAQPLEAKGWRDIETAPKDGTQIMLSNGVSVAQGWWEHEEPYVREQRDNGYYIDQAESDGFDGWLDCEGGMQPAPTHWQPLPPPPAQSEGSRG